MSESARQADVFTARNFNDGGGVYPPSDSTTGFINTSNPSHAIKNQKLKQRIAQHDNESSDGTEGMEGMSCFELGLTAGKGLTTRRERGHGSAGELFEVSPCQLMSKWLKGFLRGK